MAGIVEESNSGIKPQAPSRPRIPKRLIGFVVVVVLVLAPLAYLASEDETDDEDKTQRELSDPALNWKDGFPAVQSLGGWKAPFLVHGRKAR